MSCPVKLSHFLPHAEHQQGEKKRNEVLKDTCQLLLILLQNAQRFNMTRVRKENLIISNDLSYMELYWLDYLLLLRMQTKLAARKNSIGFRCEVKQFVVNIDMIKGCEKKSLYNQNFRLNQKFYFYSSPSRDQCKIFGTTKFDESQF